MNADAIFEAFGKMGRLSELDYQRREKLAHIAALKANLCGNCDHWMKSTCKPEKVHKQFKSCNSAACGDFVIKSWVSDLIVTREEELKLIEADIAELTQQPVEGDRS